jgi:hypothetical protein
MATVVLSTTATPWRRVILGKLVVAQLVNKFPEYYGTLRKANWIGHILRRNCLLKHVIEGKLEG